MFFRSVGATFQFQKWGSFLGAFSFFWGLCVSFLRCPSLSLQLFFFSLSPLFFFFPFWLIFSIVSQFLSPLPSPHPLHIYLFLQYALFTHHVGISSSSPLDSTHFSTFIFSIGALGSFHQEVTLFGGWVGERGFYFKFQGSKPCICMILGLIGHFLFMLSIGATAQQRCYTLIHLFFVNISAPIHPPLAFFFF